MTFFLWISNSELLNVADDKTICATENTSEEHISTLEKESQAVIDWFVWNEKLCEVAWSWNQQ